LEVLYLSDNQLESLPDSIGKLTNLGTLVLNNNQLTSLKGIGNLTNLKWLDLSNSKLTSLKGIGNLTNLLNLYLNNNNLSGSEKERLKKIFGNKVIL